MITKEQFLAAHPFLNPSDVKEGIQTEDDLAAAAVELLVDDALASERIGTCLNCELTNETPDGRTVCIAPGCLPCRGPGADVRRLARYKERVELPLCKHPNRAAGKGWLK